MLILQVFFIHYYHKLKKKFYPSQDYDDDGTSKIITEHMFLEKDQHIGHDAEDQNSEKRKETR